MDAPSIKLLSFEEIAQRPVSMMTRFGLAKASTINSELAYCAALGLCVGRIQRHGPKIDRDLLAYGQAVGDHLLERGADYAEMVVAGQLCWLYAVHDLPRSKKIKEEADFSEGTEGSIG